MLELKRESEFTKPREECPHPEHWTAADDQATEAEVLDGLWGMIRMLQPEFVIETGTYRGDGTLAMVKALRQNGHGQLVTLEIEESLHLSARRYVTESSAGREDTHDCMVRWGEVGCLFLHQDSLTYDPPYPVDFVWFDSLNARTRCLEFMRYYPMMHERTVVGFHDTGRHHASVREAVDLLAAYWLLVPVFLPTPRGVAFCGVDRSPEAIARHATVKI